jgi:hypothetical protein
MIPTCTYTGTLIMAVFCNDGLVLAGDKGSQLSISGRPPTFVTDQEKVIQINDRVIMATTGTSRITTQDEPRKDLVNGLTISKKYFRKNKFKDTTEFWRGLSEDIVIPFQTWLTRGGVRDKLSADFMYFYLDEAGSIELFHISMRYNPVSGVDVAGGRGIKSPLLFWGFTNVLDDLKANKRSDASLKNNPDVMLFMQPQTPLEERTTERAIRFIEAVMQETSNAGPSKGHVSREFSYCTLKGQVLLNKQPQGAGNMVPEPRDTGQPVIRRMLGVLARALNRREPRV